MKPTKAFFLVLAGAAIPYVIAFTLVFFVRWIEGIRLLFTN